MVVTMQLWLNFGGSCPCIDKIGCFDRACQMCRDCSCTCAIFVAGSFFSERAKTGNLCGCPKAWVIIGQHNQPFEDDPFHVSIVSFRGYQMSTFSMSANGCILKRAWFPLGPVERPQQGSKTKRTWPPPRAVPFLIKFFGFIRGCLKKGPINL